MAPGGRNPAPRAGAAVLGCAALLLASGCAALPASGEPRLRVAVSMSILADFAGEVGGEHVEVVSLVPVGADPHVHEPTPADARAVADADLVLRNGVGLEPWFDALVVGSETRAITLTEEIDHLVTDDEDGVPDPHLWMVPTLAVAYVEAIADAFAVADPANADAYARGAADYAERLRDLDTELARALDAIPPERRVLVTSHDAYGYFGDHYGLEVDTVVGVSTEEEPSARTVQRLIDRVREQGVPTVFVETTVNRAVVESIARDAGAEVGAPLYGDSVGEPGSGAETYVGMMRANVGALVDGLGAS